MVPRASGWHFLRHSINISQISARKAFLSSRKCKTESHIKVWLLLHPLNRKVLKIISGIYGNMVKISRGATGTEKTIHLLGFLHFFRIFLENLQFINLLFIFQVSKPPNGQEIAIRAKATRRT